jgi:hypothetical protein
MNLLKTNSCLVAYLVLIVASTLSRCACTEKTLTIESHLKKFDLRLDVVSVLKSKGKFEYWNNFMKEHGYSVNSVGAKSLAHFLLSKCDMSSFDTLIKSHELATDFEIVSFWKETLRSGRNVKFLKFNQSIAEHLLMNSDSYDKTCIDCCHDLVSVDEMYDNDINITCDDLIAHALSQNENLSKKFVDSFESGSFLTQFFSCHKYIFPLLHRAKMVGGPNNSVVQDKSRMATLLPYGQFEMLFHDSEALGNAILYAEYNNSLRSLLLDPYTLSFSGLTEKSTVNADILPDDVFMLICSHVDAYELLFTVPLINKRFKRSVKKKFILSESRGLARFILRVSESRDPSRLFSLWFVNRIFKSVHELVDYRYTRSPETLSEDWLMMIFKGLHEYPDYPSSVVHRSAQSYISRYGGHLFDSYMTIKQVSSIVNVLCFEPFISATVSQFGYLKLEALIRHCESGHIVSEYLLKSQSVVRDLILTRLVTLDEHIPANVDGVLKEYLDTMGITNVDLPFSFEKIRELFTLYSPFESYDHMAAARITKAWAQVKFDGCPGLSFFVPAFIEFLLQAPHSLTREELASFLAFH